MKKNYLYTTLLAAFIISAGFVILRFNKKTEEKSTTAYRLLPRKAGITSDPEWLFAKNNIEKLLAKISQNPADIKARLALANAYITESRISSNTSYYDQAAMQSVNNVLEIDPTNFEALSLQSLLYLSQHHFAEGLVTATVAEKLNSENAFVYGLLVDANIEMGNYVEAVDAADRMVTIRPDLRSYSRIAYLREIHGDYPGAIEAMRMAVTAGATGQEATEWCRVQLGKLYEATGDVKSALFQYQLSSAARPGYAYALAGLARLASLEKKYDSAVFYYQQADAQVNDIGIKESLAESFRRSNKDAKADSIYKALVSEMSEKAKKENEDASIGHYADREMAYMYLHSGNTDKALEHGLAEYNRRPKNIDVNEMMAWVYYNRKDYAKAKTFIAPALATKSANPSLLCIAGLIHKQTGEVAKGEAMIQAGLKNNPVLPEDIKTSCLQSGTN